jgi:hypothetical protein
VFKDLISPKTIIFEVPDLRAVYLCTDITSDATANCHIIVTDKELLGREDLAHDVIPKLFNNFGLRRLQALIPTHRALPIAMAVRLGFTREGTLRQALCYNGVWRDIAVLGLLRSEYERRS